MCFIDENTSAELLGNENGRIRIDNYDDLRKHSVSRKSQKVQNHRFYRCFVARSVGGGHESPPQFIDKNELFSMSAIFTRISRCFLGNFYMHFID